MDDMLSWVTLLNAPKLSARHLIELLESFPTATDIIAKGDRILSQAGLTEETIHYLRQTPSPQLKLQVEWLQQTDHYLIPFNDTRYPVCLKHIADPPAALFVDGCPGVLHSRQLAIVGSRNPGAAGRKTAHRFAAKLADAGFVVTSGMATGIDACAHRGALTAGRTLAILGNGTDICYPARHRELSAEIKTNGALVSEFPPGTPPLPNHFPRRNRIISGLSLGVIVIEAATRSGSLITAQCAVEQGREVFAVPGSIYSPLSAGCHLLIKQGAKLAESIVDILEELMPEQLPEDLYDCVQPHEDAAKKSELPGDECRLLMRYLSHDPQTLDELIEASGLTADTVSSMLLVLEVQGIVSSSGGQFSKIN